MSYWKMTDKQKLDKFKEISKELIVKEYLGVVEYGRDPEYEEELAEAGANYLMSVFYKTDDSKEKMLEIMNKRDIKHESNILRFVL